MTKCSFFLVLMVALVASVLCGCALFCQHEWIKADCLNPKTCSLCGKTEGEISGIHDWSSADCHNPETCTRCGKTQGAALGHSWVDATCIVPKTCTICAVTEGEPLGHSWVDATCIVPKTCTICAVTEGEPLGHTPGEEAVVTVDYVEAVERTSYACTVCREECNVQIIPLTSLHSDGEFLFTREQFVQRFNHILNELDPNTLYELRYIDNNSNTYLGRTGQLEVQYMDVPVEDYEVYYNDEYCADISVEHGWFEESSHGITSWHGTWPPFPSFSNISLDCYENEAMEQRDIQLLASALMMACFPELDMGRAWNLLEESLFIMNQSYDSRAVSAWAIRNGVAFQARSIYSTSINSVVIIVLPPDVSYNVDTPTQYP